MKKRNLPLAYLMLFLGFISSGCSQLMTTPTHHLTPSLGQYYQWIKALPEVDLASEVSLQQQRRSQQEPDAKLYLLLLHSLPNSSVYNPYTAKSLLNDDQFVQYLQHRVSGEDLALVAVLRDQLNQQLLLRQDHEKSTQKMHQQLAQQKVKLSMYQQANASLELKLNQLKAIEAKLSERENP